MTNPQAVMKFCESAEEGQKAELMLLVLSPFADLTIYQCKTENGTIMIVREDYQWKQIHHKNSGRRNPLRSNP